MMALDVDSESIQLNALCHWIVYSSSMAFNSNFVTVKSSQFNGTNDTHKVSIKMHLLPLNCFYSNEVVSQDHVYRVSHFN